MSTLPPPSSPAHDPLAAARVGPDASVGDIPEDLAAHLSAFEFLGRLGQGGMGTVYRVRRRADDTVFALKVVRPIAGMEAAFAARFSREAEALTRLRHPNIAAIHDHGGAGVWCWLLMDLIDGANLREVLATGQLSPAQTLALVPPLCAALQYAHDHGVVHRDLKPENILLDGKGIPYLVDFGLAKLRDPAAASGLTQTGAAMGTLHYMAPEQVANAKDVDHRADIYGLGVVLYELLTGQLPLGRFEAPSQRVQVDVRIDEVVLKALERDPERRWQQARFIGQAVADVDRHPTQARGGAPTWSLQARWALAICAMLAALAMLLLAADGGGSFLVLLLALSCLGMFALFFAHLRPVARLLTLGAVIAVILIAIAVAFGAASVSKAQAMTAAMTEEQIALAAIERERLRDVLTRAMERAASDPAAASVEELGTQPVAFAPEIAIPERVDVLLRFREPFSMAMGNVPTAEVLAQICQSADMTCIIPASITFHEDPMTLSLHETTSGNALHIVATVSRVRLTYGPVSNTIVVSQIPEDALPEQSAP